MQDLAGSKATLPLITVGQIDHLDRRCSLQINTWVGEGLASIFRNYNQIMGLYID